MKKSDLIPHDTVQRPLVVVERAPRGTTGADSCGGKGSGSANPEAAVALVRSYLGTLQSPRSRSTMDESLRRLARLAGAERAEDVAGAFLMLDPAKTFDVMSTFRQALAERYPPATANLSLSALRGLLRVAYLQGLLTERQYLQVKECKSIKGSRVSKGVALKPEDEKRLRHEALALPSYQGSMMDATIVLSIGAGLRREEVCNLALAAVGGEELHVIGKGNRERVSPIDSGMIGPVDAWKGARTKLHVEHQSLFVAPEHPDWPLSTWVYWQTMRQVAHEAFGDARWGSRGCPKTCRCRRVFTGPHDFRRTFATRMLERGFDLREVQRMMGHSSVSTTARYDKRSEERLFERRKSVVIVEEL